MIRAPAICLGLEHHPHLFCHANNGSEERGRDQLCSNNNRQHDQCSGLGRVAIFKKSCNVSSRELQ